jgi:hypothetical protein
MKDLYKRKKRNVIITLALGLACWLFAIANFSEISRLEKLAARNRSLIAKAMTSGSPELQSDAAALVKEIEVRIKRARVTGPGLALAGLILVAFAGVDTLRLKKYRPPVGPASGAPDGRAPVGPA